MTRQEQLSCLTDRPCAVCKYHSDNGCSQWKCVFEQEPSYNSVKTELDAIHNEREQAYMKGYEDASKRYRTEPCEDAISRQAAIDAIWDGVNMDIYTREVKECLEELPSVSTEKTGRWIDGEFGSKCSCCGIHTHLDKFDRPMKTKYCSMCGAKMGVEE